MNWVSIKGDLFLLKKTDLANKLLTKFEEMAKYIK